MTERPATSSDFPECRGVDVPRLLGRHDGTLPGPLVLVVGGLHGNEPAGVRAAQRVLAMLEEEQPLFAGRLVALAGNRAALRAGRRYLKRDLNRVWSGAELAGLEGRAPADDGPEGREQRELRAALEQELGDWDGEPVVLDLHTTSGDGSPFALAADTLQNRRLAAGLPVPLVLGLEEGIDGPLISYLAGRAIPALVVEGGRHDQPATEEHLVAAFWLFLAVAGCVSTDHPRVSAARGVLRAATRSAPNLVEVVHVHPVGEGDGFRMLDGFANFDRIESGSLMANDLSGPIRAPRSGLMLMPLYQPQGEDGYFLCRGIGLGWLRFSEACRRSGLENLLPFLPGVRVDQEWPRSLLVDGDAPRVVWRVLRHFGFRKGAGEGRLTRRPERGELSG